jgi:hypothetical protein
MSDATDLEYCQPEKADRDPYRGVPWVVVGAHTAVLAGVAFAAVSWGWLTLPPFFDDVFVPYLIISGPLAFFPSCVIGARSFQILLHVMTPAQASIMAIIIVPGVSNALIGGFQWYFIARWLCGRHRRKLVRRNG